MQDTAIIVPARLASSRFPRKLLHPIAGRPLILHTAYRLRQQAPELPLFFAVDGAELQAALDAEGFRTILTDPSLPSGTDRLAQANATVQARIVINVQADEPLVSGTHIRQLVEGIRRGADMATLATRFRSVEEFADPARVKVVFTREGRALYFSRATIPYPRDAAGQPDRAWVCEHGPCHLHLGMYAYTAQFLEAFASLEEGQLEQVEKLEQLRALEHGYSIAIACASERTIGIDTPADVAVFEDWLSRHA